MHPLLILLLGTAVVVLSIIRLRIGAFFGLILAALLVSFLAPGELDEKVVRVGTALGGVAGKISLVIACAAVIGKCMMDSGAADRIVRALLNLFGEKRAPAALASSGMALSIPVFFDTVFYLLIPLARTLHASTKKNYLLYVMSIGMGAAATHTLVPPTPGPLAMAENLNFDIGVMMLAGFAVSLPCAISAVLYAAWLQSRMDIPMRPIAASDEPEPSDNPSPEQLPFLGASLLPIVLPVLLISGNTILATLSGDSKLAKVMSILGNPNIALLIASAMALLLYLQQCRPEPAKLAHTLEKTLMGAGVIILITSAGGAFGAMLKEAQVGEVIQGMFSDGKEGLVLIFVGWLIACLLKVSQGSSTVSMITTSGIVAAMFDPTGLGYLPVYLATAIGAGSLCGSWMNDSGFWIVAKMSGFTETETLKTWSVGLVVISVVGLVLSLGLAVVLPM